MLDLLGMLHNAQYVLLFERARFELLSALGGSPGASDFDWPYVVARHEINYFQPLRIEQRVTVTISVDRIGNSSIALRHTLINSQGVPSAECITTLVRIDSITLRPTPWSDKFRALVSQYIVDAKVT